MRWDTIFFLVEILLLLSLDVGMLAISNDRISTSGNFIFIFLSRIGHTSSGRLVHAFAHVLTSTRLHFFSLSPIYARLSQQHVCVFEWMCVHLPNNQHAIERLRAMPYHFFTQTFFFLSTTFGWNSCAWLYRAQMCDVDGWWRMRDAHTKWILLTRCFVVPTLLFRHLLYSHTHSDFTHTTLSCEQYFFFTRKDRWIASVAIEWSWEKRTIEK